MTHASSAIRPFDLNPVVRDRLDGLAKIADWGWALETDLAPGLPPVWADPDQIGDILVDLVVEACESIPGVGTIRITTGLIRDADGSPAAGPRAVSLSVTAPGPLSPPASLRMTVEQNHGKLEARAGPEGGGTCAIRLAAFPDILDAEPGARPDTRHRGARRFGEMGPRDRAILLVEDDLSVLDLLTSALARTGHQVVTASDGISALQRLMDAERAGQPIALLVSDVVMPRMDGYALARHATAITPDLAVVFISGYQDRGCPPGAVLLQKPFSPEALFNLVSEKLEAS